MLLVAVQMNLNLELFSEVSSASPDDVLCVFYSMLESTLVQIFITHTVC